MASKNKIKYMTQFWGPSTDFLRGDVVYRWNRFLETLEKVVRRRIFSVCRTLKPGKLRSIQVRARFENLILQSCL